MHDAHAVAVVEGPQQLVEVAADIVVSQGLVAQVRCQVPEPGMMRQVPGIWNQVPGRAA